MLIEHLKIKKLLSFNDSDIELRPLNVLIGPNAVGKSNLIEVIGLLQAAPASLSTAILRGGGIRQWLWLGDPIPSPIATIDCTLNLSRGPQLGPLGYKLEFSEDAGGFVILGEHLADHSQPQETIYIARDQNRTAFGPNSKVRETTAFSLWESVLSQIKSPVDPTPITEVGNHFSRIRIYREFRTGLNAGSRNGIATSVPVDSLMDGGDNLALVLNELNFLGVHERIQSYLRRFCERFEDVKVRVGEGLARTFLREAGLSEMLSAIRMSDGTLKFLSLLAALFHPNPPPLMCIEEPEIGLHPDALQLVAEALVEASERMQLIVTTHSQDLINWLSDRPESVLVCERDFDNGTQMKRLSMTDLQEWLEHYSLGQLWRKGEIGGGRW